VSTKDEFNGGLHGAVRVSCQECTDDIGRRRVMALTEKEASSMMTSKVASQDGHDRVTAMVLQSMLLCVKL
jgi:hypothetical protein